MKKMATVSLSVLISTFAVTAAHAQASAPSAAPATSAAQAARAATKPARADAAFMKQAAQNGHAEVEGSKLALTKAVNTQVKGFAQQMVDDHTKSSEELKALAASKGVKLPTEPSMAQKARLKLLQGADGAEFDKRYAEQLGVKAHEDTLKLFQKAAANAKDPDVKAFATKTLPALQHHLQMARELKGVTDKQSAAKDDRPARGASKP